MYVTCNLTTTNHKEFYLLLRFDKTLIGQRVHGIHVDVTPADDTRLTLRAIGIELSTHKNYSTTTGSFTNLPNEYKFTWLNGEAIYYYFEYDSNKVIRSKKVAISVGVELENGKILKLRDDFVRTKNTYFSVH